MKMESLQQRREELHRKEYQLKESLLKFDKFLKVQYNILTIIPGAQIGYEMIEIQPMRHVHVHVAPSLL